MFKGIVLFSIVNIGFTVLSCVVLAYTSMASYLGPFIAPLVLITLGKFFGNSEKNLYIQSACQSGALLCTAIGFVLPAIFFCDQRAWSSMLSAPLVFCLQLFALIIVAGILGTAVATHLEIGGVNPTSELFYTIFQSTFKSSGHWTIFITSALASIGSWIRMAFTGKIFVQTLSAFFLPTTFAIGVLSGTKTLLALLIGSLFKFIFSTAHNHWQTEIFSGSVISIIQQFAVGLMVFDLFFALARVAIKYFAITTNIFELNLNQFNLFFQAFIKRLSIKIVFIYCSLTALLYFAFVLLSLPLSLLVLTLIITVASVCEVSKITSRVGLAPLGRFATFAMFGSMLLNQSNLVNVFIACFCAIACAAGANVILQSALANTSGANKKTLLNYHLIGILITSLIAGAIFLVVFKTSTFQHGSAFAQRAQMRALLMQNWAIKPILVFFGIIVGIAFKVLKIEIAMFFAGLLMNFEQIVVFSAGSLFTRLFGKFVSKLQTNEICSGLLLGESLVIFGIMLAKIFFR